jgi:acid phosphatase
VSACPQKADTIETLRALGITDIDENHVLLKNAFPDWGSEKQGRREFVAEKYRVLMLFGDDLGDFIPGVKKAISPEKRQDLAAFYREYWGVRWFILPNPVYGSWQRILQAPIADYLKGEL